MKKQLAVIMVLLITVFIGFGIIIPILPEVVSAFHLGLLLAVYSAVSFLMSPVWGSVSDRFGRRPVIITGIFGFSISFFLLAVAVNQDHLWLMYVARVLGGLFSGAVTSCCVAYVADITTEEQRTRGMGLVGMSIGLGFIFGPGIGGLLSSYGNAVPFYTSSGLSLVTMLFALIFLSESIPKEKRGERKGPRPSRWIAFSGRMKYLYILNFFVSFTLAGLESTLQIFEKHRIGLTPHDIGIIFLASGIVGALIQGGVVRRFIKKGDEQKVIVLGLVLSAIGFFLIIFSNSLLTATIYMCVFGAGNSLLRPCVTSLITQKTTVEQGVANGLSSSMDSLGRMTGPLLATNVFRIEEALPFLIGGVLCLGATTLLSRFVRLDKQTAGQSQSA